VDVTKGKLSHILQAVLQDHTYHVTENVANNEGDQLKLTQSNLSKLDYFTNSRPHDDDANSVISTGSRNGNNLDNDLGEETETAPEGEEDSVTRCICDYTHDDGYMISCDKCE
jgi:hypothetical protein